MILIFSINHDASTNQVIDWLHYYNEDVLRINGDDSCYSYVGSDEHEILFRNNLTGKVYNLKDAKACWWRRTALRFEQLYSKKKIEKACEGKPKVYNKIFKDYLRDELSSLQEYLFDELYHSIPINLGGPKYDLNRMKVQRQARALGLKTPEFRIITNGKQLEEFRKKEGRVVTKALSESIYNVYDNKMYYGYTEEITSIFCNDNIGNNFAPSLVTKLCEKRFEVRVFYLDGKFYPMAIICPVYNNGEVDFRIHPPKLEVPYKLPADVEQKLDKLYRQLGLNTGSADIMVNTEDEHIFLEINPVGQFGMTSILCNYNLEREVALYLKNGKTT